MLGRDRYTEVHYIVKNVGRARNLPLWTGDRFTEVTIKAGLTVHKLGRGSAGVLVEQFIGFQQSKGSGV